MIISKQALDTFNRNNMFEPGHNEAHNVMRNYGTMEENGVLIRLASERWGICRDGQKLTEKDVTDAGHTYLNKRNIRNDRC